MSQLGRRLFGTDGIRGRVRDPPMPAAFILRLAGAAARVLAPDGGTAVIGKDTRVSGYMLESALEAGLVEEGMDVMIIGKMKKKGREERKEGRGREERERGRGRENERRRTEIYQKSKRKESNCKKVGQGKDEEGEIRKEV